MTPAEWHSTLFQCIGTIVSLLALIASIIAFILTYKNLSEMKKQLNEQQKQYFEQNRGNLIFYVQKSTIGTTHDLIIKNFGNSPAKLMSLKISPDLDWSKTGHSNISEFNITKLSNIFLAPQQHICTIFDFTDFDKTELAVEIHYSTCGKEFTESYNVDLNYIHKVLSVEPDIKDELSALKNINKAINFLSNKFV